MIITYPVRLAIKISLMVLTGLLYLVTLLSAYGGYFNPASWTLSSVVVLIFPYFAICTLIVAAAWLIMRKYLIGAVGILVLLSCGPTFAEAVPFRFGHEPSNPDNTFKMVTFNCLHLDDIRKSNLKTNRSLHFLIHSGADFICLQELYKFDTPKIMEKYGSQVDSLLALYPYTSNEKGKEIEFLSKYPFEYVPVKLGENVKYGSVGAYRIKIDGRPLTIINVHLSSYLLTEKERSIITDAQSRGGMKKSLKEFEGTVYTKMHNAFETRARVSQAIAEFARSVEGNVIVCGDFNDVPGSWTYRNFTKRGFEDAYAQTGFGHLITYNKHLMLFHIDQILYKGSLIPLYMRKERMNASDHYPLVAEFEFL